MPQWAGSCWYYLRFIDPSNSGALVDPAKEKYWMPVDLYVGGAEHAVLHLLYARFWHKVGGRGAAAFAVRGRGAFARERASDAAPFRPPTLIFTALLHPNPTPRQPNQTNPNQTKPRTQETKLKLKTPPLQVLFDLGVVSTKEPFGRLVSQGMILGEVEYTVWRDADSGAPAEEGATNAVAARVGRGGGGCGAVLIGDLGSAARCAPLRSCSAYEATTFLSKGGERLLLAKTRAQCTRHTKQGTHSTRNPQTPASAAGPRLRG
jgi:hypothetical protein